MSYSVAQNTSFLTVASILQKIISFFYFVLIARIIGVESISQYFLAITFSLIFIVFADFGLSSILVRESARYPENTERYLNTVLSTKVIFNLLTYIFLLATVNFLNYSAGTKHLIYLAGITMFFDNLHSAFYAVFRARKNLIFESIGIACSQAITLVIGAVSLLMGWPLFMLILAFTIPSCLNILYVAYFAAKKFKLRYYFIFDFKIIKTFLIMAWPFALAAIIGRFYAYSDSLLMSKILSVAELGWWSVAYKISTAFQFVPVALAASVYPVFSSLYLQDKLLINQLFEKTSRYLFFIVFPIVFGIFVLAKPAILWLYGEQFLPAVFPLQLLMISLIFTFLIFINGALLNAIDKQKIQTSITAGALFLSIVLNLIFLPRLQIDGAAIVALFTNCLLFIIGYIFVKSYLALNLKNTLGYFNQTFWPALIMAVAVYFLVEKIHFLFTIPIGGAIYLGLVFLLGGIDRELVVRIKTKIINK